MRAVTQQIPVEQQAKAVIGIATDPRGVAPNGAIGGRKAWPVKACRRCLLAGFQSICEASHTQPEKSPIPL